MAYTGINTVTFAGWASIALAICIATKTRPLGSKGQADEDEARRPLLRG